MDMKLCVTSLAISAASGSGESLASSAAAIDAFVGSIVGGPHEKLDALRELGQAYAALKLDGQTACAIRALIDGRMDALRSWPIASSEDASDPAANAIRL